MPSPLKNARYGKSNPEFDPPDILKLRIRDNRLIPRECETIADILNSPNVLRSLRLLEGEDNYDFDFAESMEEQGQITPASVRPLPPNKESWELITGCRRATYIALRNAREAQSAIDAGESLPPGTILRAVRHDINDKQAFIRALKDNLTAAGLNVIEKATWAKNAIDRYGMSKAEAAKELGVTLGALGHWLQLLSLPHRAQELLVAGPLTQEAALNALTSMDEKGILALCDQLEEGATHPDPAAGKAIQKQAKSTAKQAKRTTGGKLSRTPAEMRKEMRASGASETGMGRIFLEYMAGERDVEDVGWCNQGDAYEPPKPPSGDAIPDSEGDSGSDGGETDDGADDAPSGAYELRNGRPVPIGAL